MNSTSLSGHGHPGPTRVAVDGVAAVVWTDEAGCRRAALDQCPHRRAPLSAGAVEDGRLRCAYHGWAFAGDGRCVEIPALGTDARIPSRARLQMIDGTEPPLVPAPGVEVEIEPPLAWLDGDTPGLEHFWHPVARIGELALGTPTELELLGRIWTVTVDERGEARATPPDGSAPAQVTTHLDHVWIAPEEPRVALPEVVEWGQRGWHHRRLSRAEGRFGVGLLLDDQLDAGHFGFVPAAPFGRPEIAQLPASEVTRDETTVTTTRRVPIAAGNDTAALRGDSTVGQHRTLHYEFHAPLWLRLQLDYEELGGSTILLFGFVPLAAGRARMDLDILFRHPDGFTDEQLDERLAFEEVVVGEDLWRQGLHDDLRLPLEPSAELHTGADRYRLECRDLVRSLLPEVSATP